MIEFEIDRLLLAQTILYFFASFLGLISAVPNAVTQANFNGHCLLYASIEWYNSTSFIPHYSSDFTCHYVVYVAVFGLVFYNLSMGIYHSYATHRSRSDETISQDMWVLPFMITNAIVLILVFVQGIILSVGFRKFCWDVTRANGNQAPIINSCLDAEHWKWGNDIHPDSFYQYFTTAQGALWVSFLVMVIVEGISIYRFMKNLKIRQDDNYFDHIVNADDMTQIGSVNPTA